tara:strand:+ start:8102 stop:8719 length:618 start_codon:yes stop_codon:yes gene_type:complete
MSNVSDVMETTNNLNYFDPSQEKTNTKLAQGVYPANIIKCTSVDRKVMNKYKARIYNFVVKVHDSVSDRHYQIEDIDGTMKDVSASDYIGREIRSAGVFFFLSPEAGDDFEANPGNNRKYMETVEALGVDCPEISINVGSEAKMVKSLPDLTTSDFLGKPVLANVGLGKPWKGSDGVERQSYEVKSINAWNEGTAIDVEADELPF